MKRAHGGNWAGYQKEYGAEPLDFSANISPLGVPDGVRKAIMTAAEEADRYPDPDCNALREAISRHEGVCSEQVLCGNGASDLIWRTIYAAKPRRVFVTAPCFGEYEAAAAAAGCAVVRIALDSSFHLPEEFLQEINDNQDIVILCQPNNPSGISIDPKILRKVVLRCSATGTRLLLDECFVGFLDEPEQFAATCVLAQRGQSASDVLVQHPNLLILKAFTKLYALAGVRLGYLMCGDTTFLEAIQCAGQPWAVSSIAQKAGIAALQEIDYVNQLHAMIHSERTWIYNELKRIGLLTLRGEANFLLFRAAKPLDAALRAHGILLRGCGDYAGLDECWHRVAVRTHAENKRLIAALCAVLEERA